jgi:SAM-dependent methyltransferase
MAPKLTSADFVPIRFGREEPLDFTCLEEFFRESYAPAPCRLIQMGCGAGRVAVYLAQRGFRVMGIDPNRELLASARERARLADVDLDLMAGDPLELPPIPEESIGFTVDFDTAAKQGNGLEREDYLRKIFRFTTRGGIILAAGPAPRRPAAKQPTGSFAFGSPFVADFTRAGFTVLGQSIKAVPNGKARLVVHARKPL